MTCEIVSSLVDPAVSLTVKVKTKAVSSIAAVSPPECRRNFSPSARSQQNNFDASPKLSLHQAYVIVDNIAECRARTDRGLRVPRSSSRTTGFTSSFLKQALAGPTRCVKCLDEANFNHRVGFLFCKNRCVLCDKQGHLGKVCPLMESMYASFFNRTWWNDHCDLGGDCPWENDALEHLLAAAAAFNRNQNASSASGTNRGSRGTASSQAPSGRSRNDRDSRSRSPSRHGSNYKGRKDYRADRYGDNRRNNGGNHGRSYADTYWPAERSPPREPTPEPPRTREGAPSRPSARHAMLIERLRLKGEIKLQ